MAKNDKILIDGIIDERMSNKIPSDSRDEVFEYFSFEQILKDYDLSYDELLSGSVDGRNDGGIDGFFIFINGHLLNDQDTFSWPRTGSILEVWIITCKHHDTFRQAPLDNMVASLSELFDFSINNEDLSLEYSEQVLFQRSNLKQAYKKVSPRLSEFNLNFCYASRGNSEEIGDSIFSRAEQIKKITSDSFGNCVSNFIFFGSTELVELYRKAPNFSLELPFSDNLSSGETYIVLVKLKDYFNFISDGKKIRRYLFDSNVRDFMGLNRVNEDIKKTLLEDTSPDFWWLNNGVTILATGASVVGKSIQIEDIQIVNGLQTSESIFRYFESGGSDINNRSVLVKVIVSNNSENRDQIIRATNNQTVVELAALHATDKIQRDIEEVLLPNEYYYERRTNFYKNQGILPERIVSPLYLASGFVSLILKSPNQATNLRSKFMKNESSYHLVFSHSTDLKVWVKIAYILKQTDRFIETKRPNINSTSEHFLKYRRHYISFITVSRILKNFNFSINDLVNFDVTQYTLIELELTWDMWQTAFPSQINKSKIKQITFLELCEKLKEKNEVKGIERLKHNAGIQQTNVNREHYKKIIIDENFVNKVDSLLPAQPWKPGTHKIVANKLKCRDSDIFSAVEILIKLGKRYNQKDGIIYDNRGNVVEIDETRVNPETYKLFSEEEN